MWNKLRARHYSILILAAIVTLETSAIAIDRFLTRPDNTAFEVVGQFKNNSFIEHFQQAEAKSLPAPVSFPKFSHLLGTAQASSRESTLAAGNPSLANGMDGVAAKAVEPKAPLIKVDPERWVDYSVGKGDSLAAIAGNFGVSVDSLRTANGVADGLSLKAGQKIKVPMAAPKMMYSVKSGDTLSRIAARFNLPLQDIIRSNNLKQDSLSLGQKIELPVRLQGKSLEIAKSEPSPNSSVQPVAWEKLTIDRSNQHKLAIEKSPILQMVSAPSPAVKPALSIVKADVEKKMAAVAKPANVATVVMAAAVKPLPKVEPKKPIVQAMLPVVSTAKALPVSADNEVKLVVHTVAAGENLASVARQYKTTISQIVAGNAALNGHDLKPGQTIKVPVSKKFYRVLQVTTHRAEISTKFCMPVRGSMSDPYGWRMHPVYHRRLFHAGVDLAASRGTPIMAAQGGTVIYSGWLQGYGKLVVIRHPNGYSTRYGHCSSIRVSTGQTVRGGQVIGGVGATGTATGNHLHFEVRRNGSLMNPMTALTR